MLSFSCVQRDDDDDDDDDEISPEGGKEEGSERGVTFCLLLPEAVADLVNAGRVYDGEIH